MNEQIPYDLITKYLAGECSAGEKIECEKWRDLNSENHEIFNQLKQTWAETNAPEYNANVEEALGKVSERIQANNKNRNSFAKIALSAAASIIVVLGLFGILQKTILGSAEVVISCAVDAKPIEYILPDGSKITLNSGSSLTYPKRFKNNERRIAFMGEGYFDIASDKTKPFIIESGNTETKVLGTEFNFRSHIDSIVQITVTEGLVSLSLKEEPSKEVFLEVGQVGEYSASSNKLEKHDNKDLNFLAWKNGRLQFIDQELSTAISAIAKHYKVEFEIKNPSLDSIEFTATFDSLSIEEVTANLELILDVNITMEGNKYVLQ